MYRRDFLKYMGLGAVTLATPKFIFDVGKNLHLYPEKQLYGVDMLGLSPEVYFKLQEILSKQIVEEINKEVIKSIYESSYYRHSLLLEKNRSLLNPNFL